jgi:Tol biopolymer transport system component
MTFTCYQPKGLATVMGIDLKTLQVVDFSKAPGTYNETEGIFPDGRYTCVEGDRQVAQLGGQHGSGNIDIWKLRLDGTGKDFVRLTHFNDYEAGKSSNPVVSTDGRFMAFQTARTAMAFCSTRSTSRPNDRAGHWPRPDVKNRKRVLPRRRLDV